MAPDQPMTAEELAAVQRYFILRRNPADWDQGQRHAARLLAEVDRLRAENETLAEDANAQLREAAARTVRAQSERDAARSRIEAALLIADSLRHTYENGDASQSLDYINGAEAIAAILEGPGKGPVPASHTEKSRPNTPNPSPSEDTTNDSGL